MRLQTSLLSDSSDRLLGRKAALAEEVGEIVSEQMSGNFNRVLTHISYVILPQAYLDFVSLAEYSTAILQKEMLMEWPIPPRLQQLETIGVIDLGVGDGSAASAFLQRYRGNFRGRLRYLGVDISSEIITAAQRRISSEHIPDTELEFAVGRFDTDELRTLVTMAPCDGYIALLLGNTMGNFVNPAQVLGHLRDTLRRRYPTKPFYLVIGTEIDFANMDPADYEREYDTPENRSLTISPLQLLSIKQNDGRVVILFNRVFRRIEEWFIPNQSRVYRAGRYGGIVHRGSRILTSITLKPSREDLEQIINNSGFDRSNSTIQYMRSGNAGGFALATVEI